MPLARIDLIKGKSPEYRKTIGDVVYQAMVEILKAPPGDRFQVINEHEAANFHYDPILLRHRTLAGRDIFIQLTLVGNRTLEQKRGFYKKVVDDLNEKLGLRREDVLINLVSTTIEDWSFGNGVGIAHSSDL